MDYNTLFGNDNDWALERIPGPASNDSNQSKSPDT